MSDWKIANWLASHLLSPWVRPTFLGCGLFKPHPPWFVPREYFDRFEMDRIELPPVKPKDLEDVPAVARRFARGNRDHRWMQENPKLWRSALHGYLAATAFADDCLGLILEALLRSPNRSNTALILCSDHGWHLGEKNHWRKFSLWEESTHIPLIVITPGRGQKGAVSRAPVGLVDVAPTLLELSGQPPRAEHEGQSLVPLLEDPARQWLRPALTTHERGNHALRSERWRYIRYSDGSEELYDHHSDPNEWVNLASNPEFSGVIEEHARWLPKTDALPI